MVVTLSSSPRVTCKKFVVYGTVREFESEVQRPRQSSRLPCNLGAKWVGCHEKGGRIFTSHIEICVERCAHIVTSQSILRERVDGDEVTK